MINRCECFEFRPEDRDYNRKGKPRNPKMEILGGGYAMPLERNIYTVCLYGRMKMSRVERKLRKRLENTSLPIAYDLYNETDVNDLSTAITATGNLCLDRVGDITYIRG